MVWAIRVNRIRPGVPLHQLSDKQIRSFLSGFTRFHSFIDPASIFATYKFVLFVPYQHNPASG